MQNLCCGCSVFFHLIPEAARYYVLYVFLFIYFIMPYFVLPNPAPEGEKVKIVEPWTKFLVTKSRDTGLDPNLVREHDIMASKIGVTPSRFREIASGNLQLDGGSTYTR